MERFGGDFRNAAGRPAETSTAIMQACLPTSHKRDDAGEGLESALSLTATLSSGR